VGMETYINAYKCFEVVRGKMKALPKLPIPRGMHDTVTIQGRNALDETDKISRYAFNPEDKDKIDVAGLEVVIIGGGFAGCTAALAFEGSDAKSVILLEQYSIMNSYDDIHLSRELAEFSFDEIFRGGFNLNKERNFHEIRVRCQMLDSKYCASVYGCDRLIPLILWGDAS